MDTTSFRRFFTWPVIIGIIVVLVVLYGWAKYNSLVKANIAVDQQWAQVQSQYQRRFDLIPNLVNSVKGAMVQEQKVFDDIAQARTQYAGAQTPDAQAAAATQVEGSLARLLVVMENYPQLKSIDTVTSLMAELSGTENRIAVERMRYNDMVASYNAGVQTFPGNLLAGMFGFHARMMFQAQAGAETPPTVNLQ
ncbi:MAG TPA: LemA family protein [Candidatus Paceibacterota bacterium]|nr:LemA family protein [Candidatus Paceibacterota bacterium]